MIGNHVVVLPTAQTKERLSRILMNSPCYLEPFDEMHVTLLVTPNKEFREFEPSETTYVAQALKIKQWYDTLSERTKLVMFLFSPGMKARHAQLVGLDRPNEWEPYMSLSDSFQLGRTNKSFVASISDTCSSKEDPFTFQGERILDASGYYVTEMFSPDLDA